MAASPQYIESLEAARVQKVQKVLKVQRVVVSPTAMSMKPALRDFLPDSARILHRMRESAKVGP